MTKATSSLTSLDSAMAKAIDALLSASGVHMGIKEIGLQIAEFNDKYKELQERTEALASELRARPASAPVVVASTGKMPAGRTHEVKAADLFAGPSGEKSDLLDFNVQAYVWDDVHPLVPAIDPNYKFKLDYLVDILWAIRNRKNMWLYGHTGTGKTTMLEQVCARLNWPVIRVNLDSGVERIDLLGKTGLKSEGGATVTTWEDGVLPQAMEMGAFLIIDEIDFGRSEVMYSIQRALEDKGLLLTEDGGRVVQPHAMFRIAATANTRGQGDELGLYQGAKVQSTALLNRFTAWIDVDYMDKDDEAKLLQEVVGVNEKDAKALALFASEARVAFKNGELMMPVSPRELIPMAQAFSFFTGTMKSRKAAIDRAVRMVLSNKVPTDNRQKLQEIANRTLTIKDAATPAKTAPASADKAGGEAIPF